MEQFSEVCADDYRHNDPQLPVPSIDSLAQYQEVIGGSFQAITDLKVVAHDIFAAGDGVADRWTFSGTQTGALGPLPTTNKPVSVNALIIPRVENQKLAE
ncbi:MAG: ester cyclase, partial [Alphaproteobacteria bacterium]